MQRIIDGDEVRSPLIAQAHIGASMAPARGLSIYFPLFLDRSGFYRELDFAGATRWVDFLEAYLGKSSLVAIGDRRRSAPHEAEPVLSRPEALDVLGLESDADEAAIRAAHKRLLALVHPDRSGSAYLANKVQHARDTLLAPSRAWLENSAPRNRAAKR